MLVNAELNVDQVNDDNRTAITKKLTDLDGVENVTIDLKAKQVTVRYDEGKVNLVHIKQAIMTDGYSVMEV